MKLFAKRALLLTVLLLCLFGISVLAASAETYTDDAAAAEAGAVVRIGDEGGDGYYTGLKEALDTIPANGEATVHLLADLTFDEAKYPMKGVSLTIEGNGKTITAGTSASTSGSFTFTGGATLNVNNVVFDGYSGKNLIYFGVGSDKGDYTITFTGVTVNYASSGVFYGYDHGFASITLVDCTFNVLNFDTARNLMNFTNADASKNVAFVIVNTTVTDDCADVAATYAANVWVARPNQYTTDDEAVAAGAVARVGDEGTGLYYTDLRSAIETCPTGGTVTVLQNATLMSETTLLNKTVTVVGKEKFDITLQMESRTFGFELNGTATLNLEKLSFTAGVSMNLMYIAENTTSTANITVNMTDVDVTWPTASGALYFVGGASAQVSLKDCAINPTTSGSAIVNVKAAVTNGVNLILDNVSVIEGGAIVHANAAGTTRVYYKYETDEDAVAAGYLFRIGDAADKVYAATLNNAVSLAASGDTITVLANATLSSAITLGSKTLTIQGASKDVTLTMSAGIQLNGGVVSLAIKNLSISSSACIVDIYTSTDTHTLKLDNLNIHSTRAKNSNIFYVSKAKAKIEVVNCTVSSTEANRFLYVAAGGNVVDFTVTDTSFENAYVARVEAATAAIGTADHPAVLTNLTSDVRLFYAYTGSIYADIYGGAFDGGLVYGGDGSDNHLGFRFNPTGDSATTFKYAAGDKYGALVYQNPASTSNSMSFSFRNTTVTDSGKQAIINGTLTKANLTVTIENSTFGESAVYANGSPKIYFGSDADAKAFGYNVRIGAEGTTADYYKNLTDALKAAPMDNGNGGATYVYVLADTTHSAVGSDGADGSYMDAKFRKKVHITSAGTTPFTVTTGDASSIAFYVGTGAEITFTNITFEMKGRLARIDGNCKIVFGAGATFNHSDTIFIYDNGNTLNNDHEQYYDSENKKYVVENASYVVDLNYTIEILEGAEINSTGAIATGLIYRSAGVFTNSDGTATTATMTVKILGTVKMTASKPIVADTGKKTAVTVYLDASKVTCPGTWLSLTYAASYDAIPVHIKGTAADAAKLAQMAHDGLGAYAMTYSADPSAEWNYYFFYHSQLLPKQFSVLNSYGGEVWQIRSVGSVYTTVKLSGLGAVTYKAYNNAVVTVQGENYRIQVLGGSTLTLDGIEIKTPGAIFLLGSTSASAPATLRLVNGAKLTGTKVSNTGKIGDVVSLVVLSAAYTNLYVDESSVLSQTGTLPDTVTGPSSKTEASRGTALICTYGGWANGEIVIEGTLTSTVTSADKTITLIRTTSTNTTISIIFDGATITPSANATTSYTIDAPNIYKGVIGLSEDVSLGNANGVTFTPQAKIGNIRYSFVDAVNVAKDGDTVYLISDASASAGVTLANKSVTVTSLAGSTFTVTNVSSGYLFTISGGAKLTLSNINIVTNGGLATASGAAGAIILDNGTSVTGASSASPFINVTDAFGTIEMKPGSMLEVTSAPSAIAIITASKVVSSTKLNGTIKVGAAGAPVAIPGASTLFSLTNATEITLGGTIDAYVSGNSCAVLKTGGASAPTKVYFTGTLNHYVSGYTGTGAMVTTIYDNLSTYGIEAIFEGATLNQSHEGSASGGNAAGYSAVFYMYRESTSITIKNSTINVGAAGQRHAFVYTHGNTNGKLKLNLIGGTVINMLCDTGDYAQIIRDKGAIVTATADETGVPAIKAAGSVAQFAGVSKLTFNDIVIDVKTLGGTIESATNVYYATDAIAASCGGYVIRLNDGTALGGTGNYATAKKADCYYKAFADAVAAVPDGGAGTLYFIARISFTNINISNKDLTLVGRDTTVSDLTATSSANADLYMTGGSKYIINLYDRVTLTFRNMAIYTDRPMFYVQAPTNTNIAEEDRDITLNFINSAAAGGAGSSVFLASGGAYNSFTVNVDATSRLLFAPISTDPSTMFNMGFSAGTQITFNIDGALEVADRCTSQARRVRIVYANTVPIYFNVSETARISFTCSETQAAADHAIFETASGSKLYATIAPEALVDENGKSRLGDMYLYYANANGVPEIRVPADAAQQSALLALTAKVASTECKPLALYMDADDTRVYYNNFNTALSDVETGADATIYVIAPISVYSEVKIVDKNVTIAGTAITGTYHVTVNKYFAIYSKGTLTFKDLNISTAVQLVDYNANEKVAGAKADKDVTINFVNTTVSVGGSASALVGSRNHYATDRGGCGEQADTAIVNIDADSVINFTTSATGNVYIISFNHNTHPYCYANIDGAVTVNCTGATLSAFELVHSNNPSLTHLNITETAELSITIAAACENAYFVTYSTGSAANHLINIAAEAITNDNGNLTFDASKVKLYYASVTNGHVPQVVISASDLSKEAALLTLKATETTKSGDVTTPVIVTLIKFRAMADGTYYYTSKVDNAVAKFEERTTTGGLHFWANATVNTSFVLNGQTVTFSGADGVTLTTSAANLFTLTNGAQLTVENLIINSTATSTTLATVGTFLRVDDAEATAKSTAMLNNVTLTASGLPFYFGGASVADVTITGGDYTGVGMFSFGIASSDLGASADVYFSGTVNLTVTGTAADHVLFTKTGSGDSRAMIFVNASSVVEDSVKVTLDYVDTAVSGSHTIYLRNNGTLTIDYTNGTSTTSGWFIGGQGSSVPYATFTNVDITGTSTDHIMRPYSGTAGAYVKFIGGSITANNVTSSTNPILNFNSKMDVVFDGVTFNSTSEKALIGGTATSYTMIDCIFNVTGPVLAKTSYTMIMKNSKIKESGSLVAVSAAKAAEMGFAIAVNDSAFYSSGLFATALNDIPDGGTATVQLLVRVKAPNIIINNKNITFVGKDSTVNDLSYASNANADLYFSGNGGYSITLQDKATVTFRNIAVHADRPLFQYGTTDRTDLAKADRDITLNFENAWVSGGSASSVFMGGGGTTGTCDAFTVNVDSTSKLMFAPDSPTDSIMFYANYTTFASFTVNLDGAIEITDRCNDKARPIWMFNADNAVALKFNVSETASIKFSCTEAQAAANHTIVDQSSNVEMTIAAAAITDVNGKSTLGDMDLYLTGVATTIPKIRMTHTSDVLEATLRALVARVADAEQNPIQYLVVTGSVYNYFNSFDAATAFAQTNGGTVQNLKQGVYADAAAAAAGGMIYRYGGAVVNGSYGVNYFDTLSALVEYAKGQGATEIAVYLLTSNKSDGSTTTLTGVTLTLDSVSSTKQTVKMGGYPVFNLGENAHLVIKNVKILMGSGFVNVTAKGEANTAKLDLEANAEIEAPNFTGGYFLYSESTALLTVNLKEGSSIKMQTNGTKTGARQGMFDFTASGNIVAEGSSITIDGTVIYGLTFDASGSANARRAAMFKMGDKTLDLYFTEHADVQLLHVNAYAGTWNAIVCLDATNAATVVSFNGGKYTTNENCNLIGLNGKSFNGTYTVTGNVDVSGVKDALVYDYATDSEDNTTVILFKDVDLGSAKMAKNNRLAYVQLENVMFASDAHAAVNYGVRVEGVANYYSLNKAVDLVGDGGTITLLSNVIGARAVITNKTLTIQGADPANPILITNGGNGASRIFKCVGNVHLTLKNLEIDAKARLIAFERDSHIENEKTVYDDVASSSLSLINTDVYGVALGAVRNAMIYVGSGTGHHNFDLHIDANSSVGYKDGAPAEIKSTRNYQVIFYNASVTGDIVIEGKIYSYVYFQGEQVNYHLVKGSNWTEYGPNAQYMILIGNESAHTFAGNIVITETATLTHKVVFPTHNENGQRVYPEEYPSLHSAYAIRVFGGNAGVIVVDGATITTDYQNEYQHNSAWIGFDGVGDAKDIIYNSKEATLHYHGVGALLATLNKTDYVSNKITVATANDVNYNIVYDATTYVANPVPDDAEATDVPATDASGYDYYYAWDLAKLLNSLTGRTDIIAYADTTTATREIIIGIANRAEVQTYLNRIEMNEFAIVFTGNKILVLAWNDAALAQAAESFKSALALCTEGNTVTLPNVPDGTIYKFVANRAWRNDFTKPADGTLGGGQYVDSNSLQYVYSGYDTTQEGQAALVAYCKVLEAQGYEVVWQNVIGNNMFRLYQNTTTGLALYVAYNDYEFKSTFYGTNGDNGLYAEEEDLLADEYEPGFLETLSGAKTPNFDDSYFENRDHQKVLRVVSMPLNSVTMPDAGINAPDFTYDKVTNTLQTTLSFQSSSVGLGHVYMLEDGRFLVIDGGGTGNTSAGDPTEVEAIYNVMVEMYTNVYGHAPTVEQPLHIAAWYLTHTHWDHVSAFNNFANTYGQDKKNSNGVVERPGIVLDYVIANVPVQQSVYKNAEVQFSAGDINNLIAKFKGGNGKYIKVCTGQKLYLANLEIEVLMTFMDHAPFDIINTNDTNTVVRFTIYNKLNDEDPADTLHSQSAQVLYLGDSWRHSSRILCEMYGGDANGNGNYLASDIVQLAHHGNIGCERILYKRIAPTAVYFSHNAPSYKSYVYFNTFRNGNEGQKVAFRYAANVWCATNAEYTWSAPYGTYNTLEFLAARPDYEGIKDLFKGVKLTENGQYDTSYKRTQSDSDKKSYIHNDSKKTTSVNIVWGDLSFTYQDDGSTLGTWNAETHQYEGASAATREAGWVANGDNRIVVSNASTADASVNVELKFTAASGYSNFTGTFSDNGTATIAAKNYKVFTFTLGTTALPSKDITDQVIGNVTVTFSS